MKNNPHHDKANIHEDYYEKPAPNDHAAVQATLALAYEQRTANLIAMVGMANASGSKICREELLVDIVEQILDRMGLSA